MTLAAMYKTDDVQTLDQHSQTNLNSAWLNDRGNEPPVVVPLCRSHSFLYFPTPSKTMSREGVSSSFHSVEKADLPLQHFDNMVQLGVWITNVILLCLIKFFFSIIPGISPQLSWTLTTLTYNVVSYKNFFVKKEKKDCGGMKTTKIGSNAEEQVL